MRSRARVFALLVLSLAVVGCGSGDPQPAAAEVPASPPAESTPTAQAAGFDPASVPLTAATVPPFPYVDWPEKVPAADRQVAKQAELDSIVLLAGEELLTVEGQSEQRVFSVPTGSSPLEMRRHYQAAIEALGGVRVNRLQPVNPDTATITAEVQALAGAGVDAAKRLDLQRYDEGQYSYEVYLARTADRHLWFVVQSSLYSVVVTTVAQSVPSPPG